MIHRGEIVRRIVQESGYSITRLALRLNKSRRHVYNIFDNDKVDYDTIKEIGTIISHDFSKEFKDMLVTVEEERASYGGKGKQQLQDYQKELSILKIKYIELLEKYNALLNEQLVRKRK